MCDDVDRKRWLRLRRGLGTQRPFDVGSIAGYGVGADHHPLS
jgi:hypothetical protein